MEAFALPDQTSESIARLLCDNIVCRHGVPKQLLSDRGANLLSDLMKEVCLLTGMEKVNTTASHPQTDGLTENFNKTLRSMLAKQSQTLGRNWDIHLQQVLFAYRTRPHSSTESVLESLPSPYVVDSDSYSLELTRGEWCLESCQTHN